MTELQNYRQTNYWILVTLLGSKLLILSSKVWMGWSLQVLSLVADALHTLIDVFSIILSLNASQFFDRSGNRQLWFHGKREAAIALLFAGLLGFADCTILNQAVVRLRPILQQDALYINQQMPFYALQLVILVYAVDFCIVLFERYEARILGSEVLRLNAKHMLRDSWYKIPLLLGLCGVWQGYVGLDILLATLLVIITIPSCWQVLNWQLPFLVQQVAIAPEALHQIAQQVEGVIQCDQICSRGIVGRQIWVEMGLVLCPDFIESAQLISDKVTELIRKHYGRVEVKIHIKFGQNRAVK